MKCGKCGTTDESKFHPLWLEAFYDGRLLDKDFFFCFKCFQEELIKITDYLKEIEPYACEGVEGHFKRKFV